MRVMPAQLDPTPIERWLGTALFMASILTIGSAGSPCLDLLLAAANIL